MDKCTRNNVPIRRWFTLERWKLVGLRTLKPNGTFECALAMPVAVDHASVMSFFLVKFLSVLIFLCLLAPRDSVLFLKVSPPTSSRAPGTGNTVVWKCLFLYFVISVLLFVWQADVIEKKYWFGIIWNRALFERKDVLHDFFSEWALWVKSYRSVIYNVEATLALYSLWYWHLPLFFRQQRHYGCSSSWNMVSFRLSNFQALRVKIIF